MQADIAKGAGTYFFNNHDIEVIGMREMTHDFS